MNRDILLVSRGETFLLSKFRHDTLKSVGYRVTYAESLGRAVALVFSLKPRLVILEESFTEGERTAFVDCLQENHLATQVLFLQSGDVRPEMLLAACRSIFSAQPGSNLVHTIREFTAREFTARKSA